LRESLCGLLLVLASAAGGAEGTRHGVSLDRNSYPQGTPREALVSAVKAAEAGRFDYLLAQLSDSAWVDDRVERVHGGRFAGQVEETRSRLDPAAVRLLRRFLDAGEWSVEGGRASVRLRDAGDRGVFLVRRDGRWYLENRSKPGS
jgi:hypothetical protein